jgi:hypothetical protein
MNDPLRSLAIFVSATIGAAILHQVASKQGAKLGLSHLAVGAIMVIADDAR